MSDQMSIEMGSLTTDATARPPRSIPRHPERRLASSLRPPDQPTRERSADGYPTCVSGSGRPPQIGPAAASADRTDRRRTQIGPAAAARRSGAVDQEDSTGASTAPPK